MQGLPDESGAVPAPSTVVVINDDPAQLRLAEIVLAKDGFRVVAYRSAEEALRALESLGPIGAIVTDVHMPAIDGWRLCRLLRSAEFAAFNRTPILVVSATFSGSHAEQVTASIGANAFLPAPYEPAALRACVRDLLAGRAHRATTPALVVDPDAGRAAALRHALEIHGYDVRLAPSAARARALLVAGPPGVAVIAAELPDALASELLREVKGYGSSTVAVVLAGTPTPEMAIDLIRSGADGYVRDPVVPEYVIELCEKARRERALMRIEELLESRTQQLRESEARFRSLFEGVPESVFVCNSRGIVLHLNRVAAQRLECASGDIIGHSLAEFLVPKDRPRLAAAMAEVLAAGICSFEAMGTTRGGREIEMALTSRRIEFERRPAIISVARDVTAQRALERRRAEFMAMVAHDIRNPLGVVLGYAEMLRQIGGLDPEQERMLRRMETNALAVVSLVSNYLDLSRIEANCLHMNFKGIEIGDVLERVAQQYEAEAERRLIALVVHADLSLPIVRGDAIALERVFGNLVHNALKFTPDGGRVVLSARPEGASVVAAVSDTGPGIAAEEIGAIFERYRRGAEGHRIQGTGLGLFIAKAIVEAHEGTIAVDTAIGCGSTFSVELPVMVPDEVPETPELRAASGAS